MIFAHIMDENLGDAHCCPKSYFPFENSTEKDFRQIPFTPGEEIIVGGGGMLHPGVEEWICSISSIRNVIVWGIGSNYHNPVTDEHILEILKSCKIVGLRDREFCERHGFDYVPCVICCSPLFDKVYEKRHDIGVYMHKNHLFRLEGLPVMDNFNSKSLSRVIEFLGSCKKVITNSYHGAYWSHLLGVEVEIHKPFSSRFLNIPKESLTECRERNLKFYNRIIRQEG